MSVSFNGQLPLLEVAGDLLVSHAGAITLGFAWKKPPIISLSAADYEMLYQLLVKAMHVLPPHCILHCQDCYRRKTWLEQDSWLFLTLLPDPGKMVEPGLSSLAQKHIVPLALLDEARLKEFVGLVYQFILILEDGGVFKMRRLTTAELLSDAGRAGLLEQYITLGQEDRPLEIGDIQCRPDLRIRDQYCLLYSLSDAEQLPAQCSSSVAYLPWSTEQSNFPLGFAAPLGLQLDLEHICNLFIWLPDQQVLKTKLEKQQRRLHALSGHSRQNARNSEAILAYLNEWSSEQRRMVRMHYHILAWTDDPSRLREVGNRVGAAIARMGATPRLETINPALLWSAGIPGCAGELPERETFLSFAEHAACFVIQEGAAEDADGPYCIPLGERLSGRPLQVDMTDGPKKLGWIGNLNKAVFGGSGSGKSYFMNHLIRCMLELFAHVVLLDVGGSYKRLCAFFGGYYFEYTEANPICFNPFWLAPGERPDTEKRESIKTLLVALWKREEEVFLRSEYVALSNALHLYYTWLGSRADVFPCFNSFYEFLLDQYIPILQAEGVPEKDFNIQNFLYVLRPFYRGGEYDYLLNAEQQLDLLQQRFIVFELDNIKDHPILFQVVTIVIMEVFINKMRNLPGVRKLIVIEEAWKAISRQGMSEYIQYLFKTVRKFSGEAIVVTQEVEDIISSPVVKQAIIGNADCKILLDQSKFQNHFGQLQELLGLTEKDKALVLSLNRANEPGKNYKEVFIKLGPEHSMVYRVELSLEEHLLYTSEESEKVRVEAYAKTYGSMREGITALARVIREGAGRKLVLVAAILLSLLLPTAPARAQVPIADVIKEGIKRVIVAVDLEIQRLQTHTIELQNVQRAVENVMQSTQLGAIAGWVQRQKDLYGEYFQELWQVKEALTLYSRVKEILERQAELVRAYQRAAAAIRKDPHFSGEEVLQILQVYDGILTRSIGTLSELYQAIRAFSMQLSDGERLQIIDAAGDALDREYGAFQQFTQEHVLLSLQRSKDWQEFVFIKSIYGIN